MQPVFRPGGRSRSHRLRRRLREATARHTAMKHRLLNPGQADSRRHTS